MADDMFAAMDEDLDGMGAEEEAEEEAAPEMDAELMLHAEAAGLSPEQAEAMKAFVERCTALKDEGSYDVEEPEAEDDDEFV